MDERLPGRPGSLGTARPIVQVGDPVLHRPCAPVTSFDDDLAALVQDMFASMYAAQGVGLAANQIGVPRRLFVYDCADAQDQQQVGVVVNPTLAPLAARDRVMDEDIEGCLSVVGQHTALSRPASAVVTGYGVDGTAVTVVGSGLLARCLQHESDHLEGILFIDRLSSSQRKRVLRAYEQDRASPVAGEL